ncbi:APC family permease [Acidisoma cladoniae]|jgi:amino acid transporter|uniref:APC family permease n=1 Tax=Acidisoma cladoniae TaxID=3040935 RepID=UPI0025502508|nr:APC family permease [Acidisoma sp. PAMC 29798]
MPQLRSDSLSFVEALGQSVANVSPTLTPAIAVAVVAATAGTASWLVYVIATIALVVVGYSIGKLASKISAAGSFFIYISRSLGPTAGMLAGWAMLAAYVFTAMALTAATALFIQALITAVGFKLIVPTYVLYFVISALVYVFAIRNIRFSSRLGLGLEVVSVAIIALVCFLSWQAHGFAIDPKQNHIQGAGFGAIAQSIVFAIFSYVGFESAATLGKETRNPKKVIPQAVMLTPVLAGIVFIVTTYLIVQGFNDDTTKLGGSAGPLAAIVPGGGAGLTILVYIGAMVSCFACALASINSFSRILFSLGRYRYVHRSMGQVHDKHQTPHIASTIGVILNFVVCAVFYKHGYTDLLGWFGTIASFGFIIVYLMCSIAAPVLLRKTGEATTMVNVMGVIGAIVMALALVGSVYPVPAAPYNYLPYGFAAYMLIGVLWFLVLKARTPQIFLSIEHDLEGIVTGAK